MASTGICQFCGVNPVNSSRTAVKTSSFTKTDPKIVGNYYWNYLRHKNILETERQQELDKDNVHNIHSSLSFNLTVTENSPLVQQKRGIVTCQICLGELEKLEHLNDQLEMARKSLEHQVTRLNLIRNASKSRKQEEMVIPTPGSSTTQISLKGSLAGKENICKALTFLSSLCTPEPIPAPISKSESPGIPAEPPPEPQQNSETIADPLMTIETSLPFIAKIDTEYFEEEEEEVPESDPLALDTLPRTRNSCPPPSEPNPKSTWPKKQCKICGKEVLANYFKSHRRIHTGEKPHQCSICDKRFCQKSTYNEHMKMHVMPGRFKCPICQHGANNRGNLNYHMRSVHKMTMQVYQEQQGNMNT